MKPALLAMTLLAIAAGCAPKEPLDEATYRTRMGATIDKATQSIADHAIGAIGMFKDTEGMSKEERQKKMLDELRKGQQRDADTIRTALNEMRALIPPKPFEADHKIVVDNYASMLAEMEKAIKDPSSADNSKLDTSASGEALKRMGVVSKFDADKALGQALGEGLR